MQAILTKYIPVTNTRGSRIKAICERGSATIPYPHHLSGDEVHRAAAQALLDRFMLQDENKGIRWEDSSWNRQFATGCLPSGDYCHVLV